MYDALPVFLNLMSCIPSPYVQITSYRVPRQSYFSAQIATYVVLKVEQNNFVWDVLRGVNLSELTFQLFNNSTASNGRLVDCSKEQKMSVPVAIIAVICFGYESVVFAVYFATVPAFLR
jgi:hypothetical protein